MNELRKLRESRTELESELYESKIQQDDQDNMRLKLDDTMV